MQADSKQHARDAKAPKVSMQTCIYCTKRVDVSRGEGDHVVPAAMGRFRGEFIFRRICRTCNSLIGKCEDQVLRCAPEAYLRRLVRPAVKRRRRGTHWVGADGIPPPQFTIDRGDHRELAENSPDHPKDLRSIDQLVLVDKENGEHYIRLYPGMTAQQLRDKIDALGITPSDKYYLHADDAVSPRYIALLKEVWPDSTLVEGMTCEPGPHCVEGRAAFTFHEDYWRAIAKIGFHYYLLNTRRGFRGDEIEFASVRRFIIEGGDREPFFESRGARFALPFQKPSYGSALLPHQWTHILAADETQKAAVAMVSLFMGPQRLAPIYHISLGRFESSLIVPGACCAHSYDYDLHPDENTYAGVVVTRTLTRLN